MLGLLECDHYYNGNGYDNDDALIVALAFALAHVNKKLLNDSNLVSISQSSIAARLESSSIGFAIEVTDVDFNTPRAREY